HVRSCELRRKRGTLLIDLTLRIGLLLPESRELLLRRCSLSTYLTEALARRLDRFVRIFELACQRISALGIRVDGLTDRLDPRPNLLELGFLCIHAGGRGSGAETDHET